MEILMTTIMNRTITSALSLLLLAGLGISTAQAQLHQKPSGIFKNVGGGEVQALNTGDGYMVGGDYWQTIKPMNTPFDGRLASGFAGAAGGSNHFILLGGAGNWVDPTGNWPSGFRYVNNFRNSPRLVFPLFNKEGWPGYVTGNPLRTADVNADNGGAGGTSRFMYAIFSEGLAAAKDPNRNYRRNARYTDATRRHKIYEAGWPTTAGIDFKVRGHQFTVNEQNMNDFVLLEISLTNTGNVDTNADGTFEATNNTIEGITFSYIAVIGPTIEISTAGDRGCNCINAGRSFGYSFAPNPYDNGNPMNLWMWYANTSTTQTLNQTVPPAGQRYFGIDNLNQLMGYTDIWNTYNVIAIKEGAISDSNLNGLNGSSPNKQTVFGTHPIGEGSRKGWYTSSHFWSPLNAINNSQTAFRSAMATWFTDYGKTTNSAATVKLTPNPAFFAAGGSPDDITTWTVANPNARPNGDLKYGSTDVGRSAVQVPVWEPQWNPGAANGSDFFGAQGYTLEYTFGQTLTHGNGPFSLAPGESMTIVLVSAAGFRLDGLLRSMQAAEWSYKQGMATAANALPVPATPDTRVTSTTNGTALIEWTDVSSVPGSTVSGYKVWKASQYKRTRYEDVGLRVVDNYHRQHEVGATPASVKKAVNPNYDNWSIFVTDIQGSYQPTEWGHYELIAKIPSGQLGQYTSGAGAGYQYAYEDKEAITGFTYWYYVSAYREGQFTGPQGPVPVGHIETSNMNRNGRNGLGAAPGQISLASQWGGTYPWSINSAFYPRNDLAAQKNLGASFTVTPPASNPSEANSLITVTPNPYKITGLNDVRNDPASHNLDFLNLPSNYTLTIIDVSGQVIFQQVTKGAVNGKYTWDMFSKDGIEVASGLYIYVVEHEGGKFVGHFSILR
jgi:hypothetical protein